MTYNGSEKHLENLARAREASHTFKIECEKCNRLFWPAGYSRHSKVCSPLPDCPVCGKKVKDKKATTCSRGCANTYFLTGEKHPNYDAQTDYRKICFKNHEKKCICCEERLIVAVYHLDHNNKNNDPVNLIPLCPTHHGYWHSRHRHLIEKQVKEYISEGIKNNRV